MLAVEIEVRDESALTDTMSAMRQWLDHRRFEPAAFRCTFAGVRVLCRVDFPKDSEAEEFARAFAGALVPLADLEAPIGDLVGGEVPA